MAIPVSDNRILQVEEQPGLGTWVACLRGSPDDQYLHLLFDPHLPDFSYALFSRFAVLLSGEIYNCDSLIDPQYPEDNDAMILLRAYRRHGEEFLKQLKGIYSVVIWDGETRLLLCSRDAFGMSPLFYSRTSAGLFLSLSIEHLSKHPQVGDDLNRAALADHLCHRYPMPEETFFRRIQRVPGGYVLRVSNGTTRLYRHWNPIPTQGEMDWVRSREIELFDSMMEIAVGRCLQRGPSGIYLSGGLDSVSIASVAVDLARRNGMNDPLALSLVFPQPYCNEEPVQTGVATQLGLRQVMITVEEIVGENGLLSAAAEMSRTWPTPMRNPWKPLYYRLATEAVRRGCKVIVTGAGGDEWLTVHPAYAADLMRSFKFISLYRHVRNQMRSYELPVRAHLRYILWTSGLRRLLALFWEQMARRFIPEKVRKRRFDRIMQESDVWVIPDPALRKEVEDRVRMHVESTMTKDYPRGSHGFYFRDLPDAVSHVLRAMDMEEEYETGRRVGISVLKPYFDSELVELLLRIPPEFLQRGGREKGLVRETVARRFPDLKFERQKKVSAVDYFRSVILSEGPAALQKIGGITSLVELGIVDRKALDSIIASSLATKDFRENHRIWDLLSLEAWLKPRC